MKSVLLLLLPVVFLASCASKFTAAQRESLSTVSIAPTAMDKKAYQRPYGGSQGARNVATAAGTGGGAIGGALGALIGEGIAAAQNNMFQSSNAVPVATVEKNTLRETDKYVFNALNADLKKDGFFASRLQPNSPNRIASTVTGYGLMRTDSVHGDLRFMAHVTTKIELIDAKGKKMAGGNYHGVSTTSRTINEYAATPAHIRNDFTQASSVAVDAFLKDMAKKTAN